MGGSQPHTRCCAPGIWAPLCLSREGSLPAGQSTHSYSLQGPLQRSEPGTNIQLTYMSSGFPSRHVTVTWLKKNHKLPKWQTHVHLSRDTYNVTSRVLVPLQADDVLSFVQCHVNHKSTLLFQKTISLDQYLRGKNILSAQVGQCRVGLCMSLPPFPPLKIVQPSLGCGKDSVI